MEFQARQSLVSQQSLIQMSINHNRSSWRQISQEKSKSQINDKEMPKLVKPNKKYKKVKILKYQICDEYECSLYQGRSLIKYKIHNNNQEKIVSENHLKNRLKIFEQENDKNWESTQGTFDELTVQNSKQKKQTIQLNVQVDQKNKSILYQRKKFRYFEAFSTGQDYNQKQKVQKKIAQCFKCGKQGHEMGKCQDEIIKNQLCKYCLGTHLSEFCKSTVICQRCSNFGHEQNSCLTKGPKCVKCGKIGHKATNCRHIVLKKQGKQAPKYSFQDIKKVKCINYCKKATGHFNCFQYQRRPPNIYL